MNEHVIPRAPRPPANSFAASRLGHVAQLMKDEGTATMHDGMLRCADICLRRGHDEDEDVLFLVRHVLFNYATLRGIDVMQLPNNATN